MTRKGFSRRTLLGRLGLGALTSPFVPLLAREVEGAGPPRRLVILHSPSGVYAPEWLPTGSETTFRLGNSLSPLEPYRSDLILFKGLHIKEDQKNDPHPLQPTLLTNVVFPKTAAATSMDQLVAQSIGGGTAYPRGLFFHCANTMRTDYNLAWSQGTPVANERKPDLAFARIFPAAGARSSLRDPSVQGSVLDHVGRELSALRASGKLGGADSVLVEEHLSSLRGIERLQATAAGPRPPSCFKPASPAGSGYPAQVRGFMDLVPAILACDLSRVVTLSLGSQGPHMYYSWLGDLYGKVHHHAITHGEGAPRSAAAPVDRWQAEQVAYLIGRLKDAREADGSSLLDSTLVLWTNEFGAWTTKQHGRTDIPFVIAGGKWAFKTGRYKTYGGESHGRLLTAVAQAFDPKIGHIGSTRFGSGPLPLG